MAGYETIKVWNEGKIGYLQLHRPEKGNAFTVKMQEEIVSGIRQLETDAEVKVIVLNGAGKYFCVGADLTPSDGAAFSAPDTMVKNSYEKYGQHPSTSYRDSGGITTLAMLNCRKPIIAAIHGAAVGIGITMSLAADIRICSSQAKIGKN